MLFRLWQQSYLLLAATLQQCQNASINWVGMLEAPGLAKTDLHVRRVDSLSSREADQF